MATRMPVPPLLLGGAAVAVVGGVVADVALGEHPTHSVVLGIVALVVAALSRRLASRAVSVVPAVAGALAAQPVLHLTSEQVGPQVGPHSHDNLLPHLLGDVAASAGVQVAVPALVLVLVAMVTHLACVVAAAVWRPLASLRAAAPVTPPVLFGVRTDAHGPLLRWCGWMLLAARRGPPAVAAHPAS